MKIHTDYTNLNSPVGFNWKTPYQFSSWIHIALYSFWPFLAFRSWQGRRGKRCWRFYLISSPSKVDNRHHSGPRYVPEVKMDVSYNLTKVICVDKQSCFLRGFRWGDGGVCVGQWWGEGWAKNSVHDQGGHLPPHDPRRSEKEHDNHIGHTSYVSSTHCLRILNYHIDHTSCAFN